MLLRCFPSCGIPAKKPQHHPSSTPQFLRLSSAPQRNSKLQASLASCISQRLQQHQAATPARFRQGCDVGKAPHPVRPCKGAWSVAAYNYSMPPQPSVMDQYWCKMYRQNAVWLAAYPNSETFKPVTSRSDGVLIHQFLAVCQVSLPVHCTPNCLCCITPCPLPEAAWICADQPQQHANCIMQHLCPYMQSVP